jgi:EAL domain-containing protein (putative c-di-GMP-specific phosphodiesterase class I)
MAGKFSDASKNHVQDAAAIGPLDAMHKRRVLRVLMISSAALILFSLFWGYYFALRGNLMMVLLDAAVLGMSIMVVVLARRGRTRLASRLLIGLMFLALCFTALVLDAPTPESKRSIHHLLLALGVMACLLMRDERPWLRYGVPVVCLASYSVFAGSDIGWVTSMTLPDAVRTNANVWINHAFALGLVVLTLHTFQADVAERDGMEVELRDALVRGEMILHYQPQLGPDQRVIGAEALVRWNHPKRGMVPPAEFISLAERTGLMVPLGDWVLRTACTQLVVWNYRPATASLRLAINVSAMQFAQPDFVERVLSAVKTAGADASRLKLELTESILALNLDEVSAKMVALKAHGIGLSLDDFGTGFSSLSYLSRLPLDELKIDRSFVRDMLNSPKDAAIVQAIVALSRSLGIEVVAEGVESDEQRLFLADVGCLSYQGYLFSRPVPGAMFDTLIAG